MMKHRADQALAVRSLRSAAPYIRMYKGKTFVVKYGGHAMGESHLAQAFAQAHHAVFRQKFEDLAVQADLDDPKGIAQQLHMLVLGASVATLIEGNAEAAALAKNAAASLIVGAKLG